MNDSRQTRLTPILQIRANLAIFLSISGAGLALGCTQQASVQEPPAAPVPLESSAVTQPATNDAPAATTAALAQQPTPEELARQQEQAQLTRDFAQAEQENTAELLRLTPELRTQVKTLIEKSGPNLRQSLTAALKGPQRRPGHAERDSQRHPLETLEFLGVRTTDKVLEFGPGEGWYTELLAPVLSKRGKLFVTLTDPNGSQQERSTLYGKRTQLALDSLPEAYGAVERVVLSPASPALTIPNDTLDVVLLFRGAHGMFNAGTLETWLSEFNRALKPKGTLGIEQHRAALGTDPAVTAKQGYLPEAFVIEQVEKAGFKLVKKSEVNANPKDTKDYGNGVWALPPTLRGGDVDREKYLAIGESDRMTLEFRKVTKP